MELETVTPKVEPTLPAGEGQVSPEQAAEAKTEAPASSEEEDTELAALQAEVAKAESPEDKATWQKKVNSKFAEMRRTAKQAEADRLKALEEAAYHRGRADSISHAPKGEAKPFIPEVPPLQMPPEPEMPDEDSFDTHADYQKAMKAYYLEMGKYGARVELLTAEHERQTQAQQTEFEKRRQGFQDFMGTAQTKYADFDRVLGSVPLNDMTLEAIIDSDIGAEIGFFLGKNPDEARRIFKLPEKKMLREIGKLEARLSTPPPKPNTSTNAPPPISPVQGEGALTGPKKLEDMNEEEYVAYMDKKEFGR